MPIVISPVISGASRRMPLLRVTLLSLAGSLVATICVAQPARDARAHVTVVDMTGAILPGATVRITQNGSPTDAGVRSTADASGIATLDGLKPGRYTITAEYPGFETGELKDIRLRAGDNKQQLELGLTGFTDTVEVGQDALSAATDP